MAKTSIRTKLQASAIALALASLPLGANAAGLGNIKVLSVLGQQLLAEIDVTASREEIPSMVARLASYEAFQQAGIDYNPAISNLRVSIEKRADNRLYLQLRSDQAINEPFLDLLLEVSWAAGRLQREYLFLLDPPNALQKPAAQEAPDNLPVAATPAKTLTPATPTAAAAATNRQQLTLEPKSARPDSAASSSAPAETTAADKAKSPAAATATRTVKTGDTLGKIASEALQTESADVNLDQMLIALFRSNRDAFIGGNINRLRTGKILTIPDQDTVAAIDPHEARKLVVAQSADFNAYRKRLASATETAPAAPEEAPQQQATGKIAAKVAEPTPPPTASKDKLEVSKSAAAKDGQAQPGEKPPAARAAALEEDLVAREKTLQDTNSRIAELDKNLADMRKALALKSQTLAAAQKQASAETAAAKETKVDTQGTQPAPPAKPQAAEPVADKQAQAPAPKKPAKKAKKKAPAPQPAPEESSFIADNPELVYGGGLIALLLGYLGFAQWRKKRAEQSAPADSIPAASPPPAAAESKEDLSLNSVFGNNGGQVVDTGSTTAGSSLDTDFSVVGTAGTETNESVDPIAEADVYMAYGRNTQAEEILVDALKKDPTRHAIHLKLLEIYAGRKALKQFEAIASDLHGQTAGSGDSWAQAAGLGRSIDPDNPLYNPQAGGPAAAPATQESPAQAAYDPTATMVLTPQDFDKIATDFDTPAATSDLPAVPVAEEVPESLDFELDLGSSETTAAPALDFDLGLDTPATPETPLEAPAAAEETPAAVASSTSGGHEIDFEEQAAVNINAVQDGPESHAEMAAVPTFNAPVSNVDLSSISLELDDHPGDPGAAPTVAESLAELDQDIPPLSPAAESLSSPLSQPSAADVASADEPGSPEVDTKLELAAAYEEMGDKDGARELLQEVLSEGNAGQQAAARSKLAELG